MNGDSHLTRAGAVSIQIAERLLASRVGERLPRIADYADEFGTGVGTVQRALRILEETGGVKLNARGQLGTYLVESNRPKLWAASHRGLMIGLMPLPYTRHYEGLATGLRESMANQGIPFSLAFMAGAILRMRALSSGHDFAIVSKLAADNAPKKEMPILEVVDFGLGSLSEPPYLVWSSKRRHKRPRVGLDSTSPDQTELARREFGDAAEYVEIPSLQVIDRLRAREFDVTVWSRDVGEQEGVWLTEFSSADARTAAPLTTEAVLVTSADDHAVSAFIESEVDLEAVLAAQRDVLAGTRPPTY